MNLIDSGCEIYPDDLKIKKAPGRAAGYVFELFPVAVGECLLQQLKGGDCHAGYQAAVFQTIGRQCCRFESGADGYGAGNGTGRGARL